MVEAIWVLVVLVAALVVVSLMVLGFLAFAYWREGRREAANQRRFEEFAQDVAVRNGGPHHYVQAVTRRPPRGDE